MPFTKKDAAKDEAEFESLWQTMVNDAKGLGLDQITEYYTTEWNNALAVSYTHLDVYKRQAAQGGQGTNGQSRAGRRPGRKGRASGGRGRTGNYMPTVKG